MKINYYVKRLFLLALTVGGLQASIFDDAKKAVKSWADKQRGTPIAPPLKRAPSEDNRPPAQCANSQALAQQFANQFIAGARSIIAAGGTLDDYNMKALTTPDGAYSWLWNYKPARESGCYEQMKAPFWQAVSSQAQSVLAFQNLCATTLNLQSQAYLNGLKNTPQPSDYLIKAATTADGAYSWLWNSIANRPEVTCYDAIKQKFWERIQQPAQLILQQKNVTAPIKPATTLGSTQQYTKYFTNTTSMPMRVMLVDIAGVPHLLDIAANSQGAITINQAGPVVSQIQVNLGSSQFYIRGAGQLGPNDKGDLGASNYIINGLSNYTASLR